MTSHSKEQPRKSPGGRALSRTPLPLGIKGRGSILKIPVMHNISVNVSHFCVLMYRKIA